MVALERQRFILLPCRKVQRWSIQEWFGDCTISRDLCPFYLSAPLLFVAASIVKVASRSKITDGAPVITSTVEVGQRWKRKGHEGLSVGWTPFNEISCKPGHWAMLTQPWPPPMTRDWKMCSLSSAHYCPQYSWASITEKKGKKRYLACS